MRRLSRVLVLKKIDDAQKLPPELCQMCHALHLDGEHGATKLHGRRMQMVGNRRRQILWPANMYVGPQGLHFDGASKEERA